MRVCVEGKTKFHTTNGTQQEQTFLCFHEKVQNLSKRFNKCLNIKQYRRRCKEMISEPYRNKGKNELV